MVPRFLQVVSAFTLLLLSSNCSDKPEIIKELPAEASVARDDYFFQKVKPLLDARCVTCHACYTSPCQLNLADFEGIRRGATKIKLYEGSRLEEIDPTRLGIDAHDYLAWNKKGFFPVAQGGESSLVMNLVKQRQLNQGPVKEKANLSTECPKDSSEMVDFLKDHAEKGMPYGLPSMTDGESAILSRWLNDGYPALSSEGKAKIEFIRPAEQKEIATWEELLNRSDPKSKLIARYLYEHLFLGAIEFTDTPGSFFRLIRSETGAPGKPYSVTSRRPYDAAGSFFYRFEKLTATITHKNHLVYPFSAAKLRRLHELFYDKTWDIALKDYPSYEVEVAANPFVAYKAIPVESRYQFLLDNSFYFVSSFIKGSVCEGATAVSVIDEKFFIFFIDPKTRAKDSLDSFTAHVAKDLATPSKSGFWNNFYVGYKKSQMDFVNERQKLFGALYPKGAALDDIWNGDGKNPEAVLTVFRHDDNSYVQEGALGEVPKTVWVMDYTIFERQYYLLAAGFDVFGNVSHQGSTRLYMDNLRVESEDLFLSFLPGESREPLRKYWYRGDLAAKKMEWLNPYGGIPSSPRIPFTQKDVKSELVAKIINQRFNATVRGGATLKACCGSADTRVTEALDKLTRLKGGFIRALSDLTLLYVEGAKGEGDAQNPTQSDQVYSLIHHKAHTNIALLIDEKERFEPSEDTVMVQLGVMGGFPNFILHVKATEIDRFVADTIRITSSQQPEFAAWLKHYGVQRGRADFWVYFDKVQSWFDRIKGNKGGILDLSKYEIW